jgi:RHS repeat-associated protein
MYDAWGSVVTRTGTSGISLLWLGERAYYFDPELTLIYVRARNLDPAIGRWTSSDVASLWDDLNCYSYSQNNPVGRLDPSGLLSAEDFGHIEKSCGFFCDAINWKLDANQKNGFIIQRILVKLSAEHCINPFYYYFRQCTEKHSRLYTGPMKPGDVPLEYYELWEVKDGAVFKKDDPNPFQSTEAHDRIGLCIADPCTKTVKDYGLEAKAWFVTSAEPPGGWAQWKKNPVTWAGGLYAICLGEAQGISIPKSGVVKRTFTANWNCCDEPCNTEYFREYADGDSSRRVIFTSCREDKLECDKDAKLACQNKWFLTGIRG